jgi:hypothetical protein
LQATPLLAINKEIEAMKKTTIPCTVERAALAPIVASLHKATKDAKDAWRRMVALETSAGHLWLRVSGENGRVEIPVPCKAGATFKATVDCSMLHRALRSRFSGATTLELQVTDAALLIFDAAWAPSQRGFPERLQTRIVSPSRLTDAKAVGTVAAQALRFAATSIAHARSQDETRPHITGLQVRCDKAGLRLIATDGHRLAVAPVPIAWTRIAYVDLCLPSDAADMLALLPSEGDVTVYVSERGMEIEQPKAFYLDAVGSPEGLFNCEQVIPRDGIPITLNHISLSTLKREVAKCGDYTDLLATNNGLFIERDGGYISIESGPEHLPARPMHVRICTRYLIEALEHCHLSATLEISDCDSDLNPITIRDPNTQRCEVIMPIRR